jgi:hypothetical protein
MSLVLVAAVKSSSTVAVLRRPEAIDRANPEPKRRIIDEFREETPS